MQYLKQEVRNRILTAAKTEFLAHGFANASIRNIAEVSDVSLGNIYRYFTDKEALFIAVCDNMLQSALTLIRNNFGFTVAELDTYPAALNSFFDSYGDEISILLKSVSNYRETFISSLVSALSDKLSAYLAEVQPEVSAQIINPDYYKTICTGYVRGLASIVKNDSTDKERQVREFTWFYFGDIAKRFARF